MKLLCLANFNPAAVAHGMGLIVNNTARVLAGAPGIETTFAFLTHREAGGGEAPPGQLRFRLPARVIDAWFERPAWSRLDFARALAGGPLGRAERDFLAYVGARSRGADAVLWFGFSWDVVSRRLPEHAHCPAVLHANDSIALAEQSRRGRIGRGLRVGLARLQERAVLEAGYAGVVYCSPADAQAARALAPACLAGRVVGMANGIDTESFAPARARAIRGGRLRLLFTGVMNFAPNLTAARLLLEEILPRLHTPVELRIVGKNPPRELLRLAARRPEVEITGRVDDIVREYRRADLFVAPLYQATGTKNKVLEALACRLPVIATASVAEAFEPRPVGLLEASSPARFAEMIDELAGRRELLEALGQAGRRSVESGFSWEQRTARLVELCAAVAGSRSAAGQEARV